MPKIYICDPGGHHKNIYAIRKTMEHLNIPFTSCSDLSQMDDTYDIALCITRYFPPDAFPKHCKVVYGPQFFVFPNDMSHPIHAHTYDPKRFFFNILSDWVDDLYRSFAPNLMLSYIACPFGIDMDAIQPVPHHSQRNKIIVYFKRRRQDYLNAVLKFLESKQESFILLQYGSYQEDEFKNHLKDTKFVIWLGTHESQGFAFQETQAANVPILVWDVKSMYDEYNYGSPVYQYLNPTEYPLTATTANCWSDACGKKIYEETELEEAYTFMKENMDTFSPREFVQDKLSLSATFHHLLKSVGYEAPV